jgi:antitoxin component YwqK of YwqJK toxin-antitoxin module
MKLPYVLLIVGVAGLAVSVHALQTRGSNGDGGVQTTYYANGQVRTESTLVNGKRDGASTSYFSDGKKMSAGAYSAGKMEGAWTFWRADGSLDAERTGDYRDGEKQSPPASAGADTDR